MNNPPLFRLTVLDVRGGHPVLQLEAWEQRPHERHRRYSWTAAMLKGESTTVIEEADGLTTFAPEDAVESARVADVAAKGHALAFQLENRQEDAGGEDALATAATDLLDALPDCLKEWDGMTFGRAALGEIL